MEVRTQRYFGILSVSSDQTIIVARREWLGLEVLTGFGFGGDCRMLESAWERFDDIQYCTWRSCLRYNRAFHVKRWNATAR